MKAKILLTIIMSTLLLLVLGASTQGARGDIDARLATFQTRLDQEGFDVTTGLAKVFNPLGDWCADKIRDAQCVNSGLYLILDVPESPTAGAQNVTRF